MGERIIRQIREGETYYGWSMEVRNDSDAQTDGVLTIAKPVLIKSEETAKWTKSSTSIYCAEEGGYIVLDTRQSGMWANVLTSSEWWEKFANDSVAGNVG